MSEANLLNIKNQLLEQRSALINKTIEFSKIQKARDVKAGTDEAEQAVQDVDNNLNLSLVERDREMLLKIDHALARITEGTYGECESCGEGISPKRLAARPFAELCIDCQEEQEKARVHLPNNSHFSGSNTGSNIY